MGKVGEFDGKRYVDAGNVGNFGFYDSFTLSAWIYPADGSGTIVSRASDEAEGKGFGLVSARTGIWARTWSSAGWTTACGWRARKPCR